MTVHIWIAYGLLPYTEIVNLMSDFAKYYSELKEKVVELFCHALETNSRLNGISVFVDSTAIEELSVHRGSYIRLYEESVDSIIEDLIRSPNKEYYITREFFTRLSSFEIVEKRPQLYSVQYNDIREYLDVLNVSAGAIIDKKELIGDPLTINLRELGAELSKHNTKTGRPYGKAPSSITDRVSNNRKKIEDLFRTNFPIRNRDKDWYYLRTYVTTFSNIDKELNKELNIHVA